MYLLRKTFVILAVGVAIVLASTPIAVHTLETHVRAFDLPVAISALPVAANYSYGQSVVTQRKYRYGLPAQKPLNGCPEMFDVPHLDCSRCGGEDPSAPRTCLSRLITGGWRCACNPNPLKLAITTVVMATVGTEVATGTYELEILTQYSSLREHITIMTVTTGVATASGTSTVAGGSPLETVAAIALVGGSVWFLADTVGSAVAVSALTPPETAENHEDDKTCPDPKDKCAECGGNQGMCTSGTNSGGCDEPVCPDDGADDQPDCEDQATCAGEDGICTNGDYEGCNCKETLPCPDVTQVSFWCSECGGADENGNCLGIPDEDDLWKGCECAPVPDWTLEPRGQKRPGYGTHQAYWDNLPDIVYAPAQPNPQCNTTQISQVPWDVFAPGIYTNFCNTLNKGNKIQAFTQKVDNNGDVIAISRKAKRELYGRTPPPNPAAYSSYTFELNWSGGDGSCSSDCSNVFHTIAESECGHTSGEGNVMASTAQQDTGCGRYSYTIANTADPSDQPVAVAPTIQDHYMCTDPTITTHETFSLADAQDAISKFCTGAKIIPYSTYRAYHVNTSIYMQIAWNDYGQQGCGSVKNPDGSFQNVINQDQCSAYLLKAVNSCDTNTVNDKLGGSYTWSSPIGCIEFSVFAIRHFPLVSS